MEKDDLERSVLKSQSDFHDSAHDYDKGSPHLRHKRQRLAIETQLRRLVAESFDRSGRCRIIEVGAGHGTFTDCLVSAGAQVLVTEASSASAERLTQKFVNNDRVEVCLDPDGEVSKLDRKFDLAVCISVLHHIPDYLAFVERLTKMLVTGGALYSVQDPLWYARLPRGVHQTHFGAYFVWRVFQGKYSQGLSTRIRRLRGVYDESKPSDLVEYHVVREGVDEVALEDTLRRSFEAVELFPYWSTQSRLLQALGERSSMKTNFGVIATGRRE